MDGKGIAHPFGVNHDEDAERLSSILSPDSFRICTATLARRVSGSTRALFNVGSVEHTPTGPHGCLSNKPECKPIKSEDESLPIETTMLSDGSGFPIPAAGWNTTVPVHGQDQAAFATTAQFQTHQLAPPSSHPASQYKHNFPYAGVMDGSICRSQHPRENPPVSDLTMLQDPEPSYMRHSYREEIEAANGGIRPDDLLRTYIPMNLKCILGACDRVFDDEDEAEDHFQLDHNYPENCVCRFCRDAFSSSFEKCVHDYHHHRNAVCRFSH